MWLKFLEHWAIFSLAAFLFYIEMVHTECGFLIKIAYYSIDNT